MTTPATTMTAVETVKIQPSLFHKAWDSVASTAKKVATLIQNLLVKAYEYLAHAFNYVYDAAHSRLFTHVKPVAESVDLPKAEEIVPETMDIEITADVEEMDDLDEGEPIEQPVVPQWSMKKVALVSTAVLAGLTAIGTGIIYRTEIRAKVGF